MLSLIADMVSKKQENSFSKRENWPNVPVFEILQKKTENMPHMIFSEESRTGLGFEIRHRQQKSKMLVYAQCLTGGQSSSNTGVR